MKLETVSFRRFLFT